MDIFQAIIIGIIEGFTEFLPISSTGHMIVASKFMGIEESALMHAYEVIIQFAAIMAVMLLYREKITFKKVDLWMKLFVAFLPLAIVGFIFKDVIKTLFNVETVAWMFIIGGLVSLSVLPIQPSRTLPVSQREGIWRQRIFSSGAGISTQWMLQKRWEFMKPAAH